MVSGSLLFCPACGTLLDLPTADEPTVVCEQCKFEEQASGAFKVFLGMPILNMCPCFFCGPCGFYMEHVIDHTHTFATYAAYENVVVTTRSHPEAFPSALRQKRKIQTKVHESGEMRTIVSLFCWIGNPWLVR